MTLKDENAAIKAVMFRSYASRLRFVPEDGMNVLCRGCVSVLTETGHISCISRICSPMVRGRFLWPLNNVKKKLSEQGLFLTKSSKAHSEISE